MTTDAQQKKPRVTYPLSVQEVDKLEALEKDLKIRADEAAKTNRVGFHRAYMGLMRSTTKIVTRERNRMKREELARQNQKSTQLKEKARLDPSSQYTDQGNVSADQSNGSTN